MSKNYKSLKLSSSSSFFDEYPDSGAAAKAEEKLTERDKVKSLKAIVFCEGNFGTAAGEVANGLVRDSRGYEVISVIDSEKSGQDSGKVLGGNANGIPVFRNLGTALAQAGGTPGCLIFGGDVVGGVISEDERRVVLRAIGYKMDIVSGVWEILKGDTEISEACVKAGVEVRGLE